MAFTKDEIKQIGNVVVEVTTPMFDHVIDVLSQRMDGIDSRIDGLENRMEKFDDRVGSLSEELREFKAETRAKFAVLEQKLDEQTISIRERLDSVNEDIEYLYKLVDVLEHGTPAEKQFAKLTIEKQVPLLFRSLKTIAKKAGVELPKA